MTKPAAGKHQFRHRFAAVPLEGLAIPGVTLLAAGQQRNSPVPHPDQERGDIIEPFFQIGHDISTIQFRYPVRNTDQSMQVLFQVTGLPNPPDSPRNEHAVALRQQRGNPFIQRFEMRIANRHQRAQARTVQIPDQRVLHLNFVFADHRAGDQSETAADLAGGCARIVDHISFAMDRDNQFFPLQLAKSVPDGGPRHLQPVLKRPFRIQVIRPPLRNVFADILHNLEIKFFRFLLHHLHHSS